jgi:solute carrier family 34 (sodium-dependent phosphate cotransporter)
MRKGEVIKRVILLLIITYIFLVGIKLMGSSFKLFGSGFVETLVNYTANPLVALFIGILATSLVQSSSVTTSIIVGLVGAGTLPISGAIPMIMGANIGTSVTNTIVSLGHVTNRDEFVRAFQVATVHDFFNFIVVIIMFPLELYFKILEKSATWMAQFIIGSNLGIQFDNPLNMVVKPASNALKDYLQGNMAIMLILSLLLIFISLRLFVKVMTPLAQTEFRHLLRERIFRTPRRSFACGLLLTIMVQSSSVSTSLIVPIAGVGILGIDRIFPYILGANIGTTFTSLLASSVTGSPQAVIVALAHLLFNTFGSIIIYPIRKIPIGMSRKLARKIMYKRFLSIAYVIGLFYVVPLLVVFFFH